MRLCSKRRGIRIWSAIALSAGAAVAGNAEEGTVTIAYRLSSPLLRFAVDRIEAALADVLAP